MLILDLTLEWTVGATLLLVSQVLYFFLLEVLLRSIFEEESEERFEHFKEIRKEIDLQDVFLFFIRLFIGKSDVSTCFGFSRFSILFYFFKKNFIIFEYLVKVISFVDIDSSIRHFKIHICFILFPHWGLLNSIIRDSWLNLI